MHPGHARLERECLPADVERRFHDVSHEVVELPGVLLAQVLADEDELRAARAKRRHVPAGGRHDALGDRGEHLVSRLVAVRGVYLREAHDLDADDARGALQVPGPADGDDEAVDVAEPRGRVDVLDDAAVHDGAHEQRRLALLGVEPVAAALADDVLATGVERAVPHGVVVGLSGEQARYLVLAALAVVWVDAPEPDVAGMAHVGAGQIEVADGVARPQRLIVVDVAREEVAARRGHGERLEDALVDVDARLVLGGLALAGGDAMRELVAVHLLVGVRDHLVAVVAGLGVDVRAPVAERADHAPLLARLRDELLAALLEPLGKLVLGVRLGHVDELVAADAEELLAPLAAQLEHEARLQNVAVALLVAKVVVAALEVVDVDEGHRERLALLPQGLHGALVEPAVAHAGERVGVGAVLELGVAALDLADHAVEHGDVLALALELGGFVCLEEARAQGQELCEALAHVLEAGDEGVVVVGVL